jgi:ribonuclease-3
MISMPEETTGGRQKESILANTMEAIVGAIFLDGGYPAADKFLRELLNFHSPDAAVTDDFKSKLQEIIQSKHKTVPGYKVLGETGPEHSKTFKVEVTVGKERIATGSGRSKKEAQQDAAKNALAKLEKG